MSSGWRRDLYRRELQERGFAALSDKADFSELIAFIGAERSNTRSAYGKLRRWLLSCQADNIDSIRAALVKQAGESSPRTIARRPDAEFEERTFSTCVPKLKVNGAILRKSIEHLGLSSQCSPHQGSVLVPSPVFEELKRFFDNVLTATAAANYLGMSPSELMRLSDAGLINPLLPPSVERRANVYNKRKLERFKSELLVNLPSVQRLGKGQTCVSVRSTARHLTCTDILVAVRRGHLRPVGRLVQEQPKSLFNLVFRRSDLFRLNQIWRGLIYKADAARFLDMRRSDINPLFESLNLPHKAQTVTVEALAKVHSSHVSLTWVAKQMGIDKQTIQAMVRKAGMPSWQLGLTLWRTYRRSDIEPLLGRFPILTEAEIRARFT